MSDLADAFTRMAERIRAIQPDDFNGALVAVGPDGVEIVMLMQGSRDEIVFWSVASTKVDSTAKDVAQRATQPVFGQYR